MQTAQLDRDLIRSSEQAHPVALIEIPLVAPAFPEESDFERVKVEDSSPVNNAVERPDCSGTPGVALDSPTVTIIMTTYQGERFLDEQLHSIATQTHRNWRLLISDDGSTD